MKKLFSLLFVALLTLSAGAATYSFTFESSPKFSTDGGTYTYDDVTWTYPSSPYISYEGGATSRGVQIGSNKNPAESFTFSTSDIEGTITKITVKASSTSSDADLRVTVGNSAFGGIQSIAGTNNQDFTFEGSAEGEIVVTWTNNAIEKAMYFKSITVEYEDGDTPPTPAVAAPVFNPNGGEFAGSLAVTLSSASEPCDIFYFEGTPDGDWANYTHYSGEFYVTETKTYTAYASKGGVMSDYTTVTFTKVNPQVATPTFETPSGSFDDEQIVTINCATNGATIMYKINDGEYQVYDGAFSVTETSTIKAYGMLDGYNNSEVATVTYTKNEPAPAATYELVTDVTTLQAGDKIALVGLNNADAFVMSEQRTNNFGGAAINIVDNEFSTNKAAVITLEQNGDYWNLAVEGGYLYAAASSSNNMKVKTTVDENGNANATIANGDDNEAVIVFHGTNTHNIVRFNYNGNNPTLFSCYEEGKQAPVYIYKQTTEVVLPATPTITPESQEFTEPFEVTITNNEPGATLMYALNDGEFTEYTAAIPVSETTTVKAYATKDGVNSEMATATYTYKPAAITVATLAEVNALDSAAVFTFTDNIVVTHKNGKNLWVRDNNNGSALIFNTTGDDIVKGVVIAPNWGGTKTLYNGETEIIDLKDFAASGTTQEVAPFERQNLTIDNYAEYVILKNVSIDSTYTSGGKTNYVTNNGDIVRLNWTNVAFTPVEGATYDFIGVVSAYQGVPQLYLTDFNIYGVEPEVPEVATIAAAEALDLNTKFSYIGEAVVVYHPASDLRYTYIYDGENYGLIYDGAKSIPAMDKGTVLNDEWTAVLATYNGAFQFTNPEGVEASNDPAVEVNPIEMTNVTLADAHKYIMMKGQTLTSTANKTWANADGLLFYNKFNNTLNIEDGKTYDVEAMVGTYKVNDEFIPEVFIISATETAAQQWALGDVNHDTFVNVADVTALIKYVLSSGDEPEVFYTEQANVDGDAAGIFNVADVTALIQLVLNQ